MKKYLLVFTSLLLFLSFTHKQVQAELASPEEMEAVCQNWLTLVVHEQGGWAGDSSPYIVDVQEIVSDGGVTMARCYSIAPLGYVVVPVLKELPPIKAYSTTSNLDAGAPEGFAKFLRQMLEHRVNLFKDTYGDLQARQPAGGNAIFGREHRVEWDSYTVSSKQMMARLSAGEIQAAQSAGPLLASSWHQGAPFNKSCPMGDGGRTLVGCVATAAAQILNYHKFPPVGSGSHSYWWSGDNSCDGSTSGQTLSATFSDAYDWVNMADDCNSGCTPEQEAAVAELCYETAVAFEMDFGACASGAFMYHAANVFPDYFNYRDVVDFEYRTDHTPASWFALIQDQINSGYPTMYGIYSHAIVCDGWRISGSLNQYHMNYGWGGSYTGWYTVDNLHCPWSGCAVNNEYMIRNIIPPCHVVPASLDFGEVAVGCHVDTAFTIYNNTGSVLTGDVSESCDDITLLSGSGPFSLAVGESQLVTVRYEPSVTGSYNCVISTGTGDCGDVHCNADAISPCVVSEPSINFGPVALGDSVTVAFSIENHGCSSMSGTVSEPCGHYEIVSGAGSFNLDPDSSKVVEVKFKPTTIGSWNCMILISGGCTDVFCEGICYEPPPHGSLDPDTLDFGPVALGGYSMKTFDITNTGYGTLDGTVSETCDNFVLVSGQYYSLTHGQSQTVSVLYMANTAGPDTCRLDMGDEDCDVMVCVGYGDSPSVCVVEPDTLDYGVVTVGDSLDLSFVITNAGGETLTGAVDELCDHYQIVAGAGGYALATDESLAVTVRYKPSAAGAHSCQIETGSAECADVTCTGTGDNPPLCLVEPDSLDYGIVYVTDSLDLDFRIVNIGGGVLGGSVSDTSSCFDVVAGGGPFGLAAGETLRVTVRFKPAADGPYEGWIETGTGGCADVYVQGTGDDISGLAIENPNRFYLYQNYPNPFNPSTRVYFTVPEMAHTVLSVYNIEGKLIKTLVSEYLDTGPQSVEWNATDQQGNPVSSGVYFYRLKSAGRTMTRKMILMK